MKKIIIFIILILLTSGCSMPTNTAKDVVDDYLSSYQNLSKEVINDINVVVDNEKLNEEQKNMYFKILEKQYKDLKYEIVNESYEGNTALVTAKIEVYDLFQAQKIASDTLKEDITQFYDKNKQYSNELYMTYKLNLMYLINERINYTIEFNIIRENDTWILKEISSTNLEKIHGIYDYENVN